MNGWKQLAVAAVLAAGSAMPPALAADDGSIARGGRLYDHWSRELRDRPPHEAHPAASRLGGAVTAADSWRCVECHGSDYKGRHGITGIRDRQGGDPAAVVALLEDATHGYLELLRKDDLLDLAHFVTGGQFDLQAVLASWRPSKSAAADVERRFGSICAGCHGLDGGGLREIGPLGDAARQRPHEVLHVVLNGHPGGNMPGLRPFGPELAAGFVVYLQTLPGLNLAASIAHGGRLYDNWITEFGARRPWLPHPAYPPDARHAKDAALTWRCKSCHGWDYLGSRGSYATGAHATGIVGIRAMAGADPARIESILREGKHQYGAVLRRRDLQDLANFVSAGQVDMDAAIDRGSLRARGDAARAGAYFGTLCAVCHGRDGRGIGTAPPLGEIARTNPWESLHKILNGHPDEKMPALRELDRQLLIDILALLQTLPPKR